MSNRRRRPIGLTTKLTAEEYATLKAQAGTRTVSEWARETLLAAAAPARPAERAILADVLGVRLLLVNLAATPNGGRLSPEAVTRLVASIDREKDARARERLAAIAADAVPASPPESP